MEVIQDQITDEQISNIKQSTCPSLSGRSELTYSIASTSGNQLLIRIDKNSGAGKFNNEWVPLDATLELISKCGQPFHSSVLKTLYEKKSSNSAGFLCACLVHLGLIAADENGGYRRTKKGIKSLIPKARSRRAA